MFWSVVPNRSVLLASSSPLVRFQEDCESENVHPQEPDSNEQYDPNGNVSVNTSKKYFKEYCVQFVHINNNQTCNQIDILTIHEQKVLKNNILL